tara:strand:- start:6352 stop:6810 length:459 start_codon:yes stop_codon:yes gene_type:complete
MSEQTMYSNFKQNTYINGKKYNEKEYNFAINPDNKKKVYAYLKLDDDRYLYQDDLENFYKIFSQNTSNSLDLFDLLSNDLENIKNFNKFDKIKIKSSSRLSKKQRKKYIDMLKKNKSEQFSEDDILIFNKKKFKNTRKNRINLSRKRLPPKL